MENTPPSPAPKQIYTNLVTFLHPPHPLTSPPQIEILPPALCPPQPAPAALPHTDDGQPQQLQSSVPPATSVWPLLINPPYLGIPKSALIHAVCVAREKFFSRSSTMGREGEKRSSRGGVAEANSDCSFAGDDTSCTSSDNTGNHASSSHGDDDDEDAMMSRLPASTVLLLFDPEYLTAANFHREFFSTSVGSSDDSDGTDDDDQSTHKTAAETGVIGARGRKRWGRAIGRGQERGVGSRGDRCHRAWSVHSELVLLEGLLTSPGLDKHSKSPTLWALRQWVITNATNTFSPTIGKVSSSTLAAFVHGELCLVARANDIHVRNYRAWQHARSLVMLGMEMSVGGYGDGGGWVDKGEHGGGVEQRQDKLRWINSLAISHFDTHCLRRMGDISVWAFLGFLLSLSLSLSLPLSSAPTTKTKIEPELEAQLPSGLEVESLDMQLLRHLLLSTIDELQKYHSGPCPTSGHHIPMRGQGGESMAAFIRMAVAMAMVANKSRSWNMDMEKESETGKGEGRAPQVCNFGDRLFAPGAGGAFTSASLVGDDGQEVTLDNLGRVLGLVQSMRDMRNIHAQRAYAWVSRWAGSASDRGRGRGGGEHRTGVNKYLDKIDI